MTAREPWPLLAALDELLAREGWHADSDPIAAVELGIANDTGIGRLVSQGADVVCADDLIPSSLWSGFLWDEQANGSWDAAPPGHKPPPDFYGGPLQCAVPFLRSRDAAAMLEEAVMTGRLMLQDYPVKFSAGRWWQRQRGEMAPIASEAAARTRAALEAGFRIGLWPVRST